ncbi:MAG TPA: hypothetical protein ENK57_24905, partial [Polyangiaceae bacterium]|nr:hypothetical protein [Polyangiaceae bacterium]
MRWAALAATTTGVALLVVASSTGCGSDVTTFPSGGSGGVGGSGGQTSSVAGGFGGEGGGEGGSGGGEAACDDFGAPCTSCLATSELCQDLYCGCLDSPQCAGFWQCAGNCNGDPDCFDGCELAFDEGYADFLEVRDCMGEDCSLACGGVM